MKDVLNYLEIENKTIYKCIVLDIINSTNTFVKETNLSDKTVVIADYQTNGRGRLGRTFISQKGNGIYMSIVLKKFDELKDITSITCLMAVVISKVLDEVTRIKTYIKWVNDIYINDKKVCGILVEGISKNNQIDELIIGVGINVYKQEFPIDLMDKVTSLENNTNNLLNRNDIIIKILNQFEEELSNYSSNNFRKEYRGRSNLIGKIVAVKEKETSYIAKVKDISDDGGLIVVVNNEERKLYSGEVERIIIDKNNVN